MDAHAGWYQDPWGQTAWRWWDGADWTGHVRSHAAAVDAALKPAQPAPKPNGGSGWAPWVGFGLAAAIIAAVVVAVLATQTGPQSVSASSSTVPASVTAPPDQLTDAVVTDPPTTLPPPTTVPMTTRPKPKGEYPKEVAVTSIPDSRVRSYFEREHYTVAVQLAPGIWANRGTGPLGTVDDYTGVVGLCADFNQYEKSHSVGGACW